MDKAIDEFEVECYEKKDKEECQVDVNIFPCAKKEKECHDKEKCTININIFCECDKPHKGC